MQNGTELKPGDPCPTCAGELKVDTKSLPERAIARYKRRDHTAANVARFTEHVNEKAAADGVIHKCTDCGYTSRFPQQDAAAAGAQGPDTRQTDGARA